MTRYYSFLKENVQKTFNSAVSTIQKQQSTFGKLNVAKATQNPIIKQKNLQSYQNLKQKTAQKNQNKNISNLKQDADFSFVN